MSCDSETRPADGLCHWPPVIGICGPSGSGKTRLVETLVRGLTDEGLAVGYVKHCGHPLALGDRERDTGKLFDAGAGVVGHDGQQVLVRCRDSGSMAHAVRRLGRGFDLVIVEGYKRAGHRKLWLRADDEPPPAAVRNVVAVLEAGPGLASQAMAAVREELLRQHRALPLVAGILPGPHACAAAQAARAVASDVVLLGREPAPGLPTVAPVIEGTMPLAAVAAAFRWAPDRRWLIVPGDRGVPEAAELRALVAGAQPGRWAVRLAGRQDGLLGLYDPAVGELVEAALRETEPRAFPAIPPGRMHVVSVACPPSRGLLDLGL